MQIEELLRDRPPLTALVKSDFTLFRRVFEGTPNSPAHPVPDGQYLSWHELMTHEQGGESQLASLPAKRKRRNRKLSALDEAQTDPVCLCYLIPGPRIAEWVQKQTAATTTRIEIHQQLYDSPIITLIPAHPSHPSLWVISFHPSTSLGQGSEAAQVDATAGTERHEVANMQEGSSDDMRSEAEQLIRESLCCLKGRSVNDTDRKLVCLRWTSPIPVCPWISPRSRSSCNRYSITSAKFSARLCKTRCPIRQARRGDRGSHRVPCLRRLGHPADMLRLEARQGPTKKVRCYCLVQRSRKAAAPRQIYRRNDGDCNGILDTIIARPA